MYIYILFIWGFHSDSVVKNLPAMQETQVQSWVGRIPSRRIWWPTAVFLPGKSHGQRNLMGYSPWGLRRVRYDLETKQQLFVYFEYQPLIGYIPSPIWQVTFSFCWSFPFLCRNCLVLCSPICWSSFFFPVPEERNPKKYYEDQCWRAFSLGRLYLPKGLSFSSRLSFLLSYSCL